MNIYNNLLNQLEAAGFKLYVDTRNENGVTGSIMTNTDENSPFSGEVLDVFEDGTFAHYSQFKAADLHFKFN